MTFDCALEFFLAFGGLKATRDELIASWPFANCKQLHEICMTAHVLHRRSKEEISIALFALIWKDGS